MNSSSGACRSVKTNPQKSRSAPTQQDSTPPTVPGGPSEQKIFRTETVLKNNTSKDTLKEIAAAFIAKDDAQKTERNEKFKFQLKCLAKETLNLVKKQLEVHPEVPVILSNPDLVEVNSTHGKIVIHSNGDVVRERGKYTPAHLKNDTHLVACAYNLDSVAFQVLTSNRECVFMNYEKTQDLSQENRKKMYKNLVKMGENNCKVVINYGHNITDNLTIDPNANMKNYESHIKNLLRPWDDVFSKVIKDSDKQRGIANLQKIVAMADDAGYKCVGVRTVQNHFKETVGSCQRSVDKFTLTGKHLNPAGKQVCVTYQHSQSQWAGIDKLVTLKKQDLVIKFKLKDDPGNDMIGSITNPSNEDRRGKPICPEPLIDCFFQYFGNKNVNTVLFTCNPSTPAFGTFSTQQRKIEARTGKSQRTANKALERVISFTSGVLITDPENPLLADKKYLRDVIESTRVTVRKSLQLGKAVSS